MDGDSPAKVPDAVIDEIRSRERNGVVELPQPPSDFRPGQQVRIVHGVLARKLAIYSGMKSSERVEILLAMLGAQQRVIFPGATSRGRDRFALKVGCGSGTPSDLLQCLSAVS